MPNLATIPSIANAVVQPKSLIESPIGSNLLMVMTPTLETIPIAPVVSAATSFPRFESQALSVICFINQLDVGTLPLLTPAAMILPPLDQRVLVLREAVVAASVGYREIGQSLLSAVRDRRKGLRRGHEGR